MFYLFLLGVSSGLVFAIFVFLMVFSWGFLWAFYVLFVGLRFSAFFFLRFSFGFVGFLKSVFAVLLGFCVGFLAYS